MCFQNLAAKPCDFAQGSTETGTMAPFIAQPGQFPSKFKYRILVAGANRLSHRFEIPTPLPRNFRRPFYERTRA